jgi:hypothetical protein
VGLDTLSGENLHGASFSGSHPSFLSRFEIVISSKMQPAMDEVKSQLSGEIMRVRLGILGGTIG